MKTQEVGTTIFLPEATVVDDHLNGWMFLSFSFFGGGFVTASTKLKCFDFLNTVSLMVTVVVQMKYTNAIRKCLSLPVPLNLLSLFLKFTVCYAEKGQGAYRQQWRRSLGGGGNCPSNLRINNCDEILDERYLNFRSRV